MILPMSRPLWRSLMYVPANNERFLARAVSRGADAIILDLEDSIPPAEKANARFACQEAIDALSGRGTDILVRINSELRLAVRDLEAIVRPGVRAIFLPKVVYPGTLLTLSDVISELEDEAGTEQGVIGLVPMLETPQSLFDARAIAEAGTRNVATLVGGEDLAAEAGFEPSPETLTPPKLHVAMAAKAAGILALGVLDTLAGISDLDNAKAVARRSARFGFDGATCVHPSMVSVLNDAFTPLPEDIDMAHRTVDAMAAAWSQGRGAARLEGRMIDMPVLKRAQNLLKKAEQIEIKQKAKAST